MWCMEMIKLLHVLSVFWVLAMLCGLPLMMSGVTLLQVHHTVPWDLHRGRPSTGEDYSPGNVYCHQIMTISLWCNNNCDVWFVTCQCDVIVVIFIVIIYSLLHLCVSVMIVIICSLCHCYVIVIMCSLWHCSVSVMIVIIIM